MTFSTTHLIFISLGALGAGIIFYGFYDEKIHIDYSLRKQYAKNPLDAQQKTSCQFSYDVNGVISTVQGTVLLPLNEEHVKNLINAWLAHFYDSQSNTTAIECTNVTIDRSFYYCSFTQSPFSFSTPIHEKYSFLKGLVITLAEINPQCAGIIFLINHQEWIDSDLDFSLPWSVHIFK